MSRGTPQGSIISPTLFNILINDLARTVGQVDSGIVVSQFADDSSKWLSGRSIPYLQTRAQRGLDQISEWCKNWGFKISTGKTVGIIFGGSNRYKKTVNLTLGGTPVKFEQVVKFLGMYLDSQMLFTHHIKHLNEKCQKGLNLMRAVKGTKFGCNKQSLLLLYKSLILSQLDYGAPVYQSASKAQLAKLDIIQGKALRIALGALPTTDVELLCVEAGVLPLRLRREEQVLRFWARTQTRAGSWESWEDLKVRVGPENIHLYPPGIPRAREREGENPVWKLFGDPDVASCTIKGSRGVPFGLTVDRLVTEYGLGGVQVADFTPRPVPPWTLLAPPVSVSVSKLVSKSDPPHLIRSAALEMLDKNHKHRLQIFTDGSKDPNLQRVSAAFSIPSLKVNKKFRISDNVSILTAELIGIIRALSWVIEHEPLYSVVLTDSLSGLLAIKNYSSKSRPELIWEIWHLYNIALKQGLDIKLEWIPAHVGIFGNESADSLAKSALAHPVIDTRVGLSPTEIYSMIRPQIMKKWKIYTETEVKFKKMFYTSVGLQKPINYHSIQSLDRCITRLKLGKTMLPASSGCLIKKIDENCTICLTPFTAEHWILSCPVYQTERESLKNTLTGLGVRLSLPALLCPRGAAERSVYRALATYIVDCEMGDGI
ncbi:MAG: ribonuclease H family protein [Sedimenticola sp.]